MNTPQEFAPGLVVHGLAAPLQLAQFGLIAFDMDSTLINIECVDEIADFVGRKAEVAAITEAAMRGEIADYKESLRRRVALLAGVPETVLGQVYRERLRLNPGVERFVQACQSAGLRTLLVSGGFTYFSERVRDASSSTSHVPTRWASPMAASPAPCCSAPGATSSTGRRNGGWCWRSANSWASRPSRPSPWATARTTCR